MGGELLSARQVSRDATAHIPVVVLNLRDSKDRLSQIAGHLAGLGVSFRRFEAVDGRYLTEAQRACYEPTIPDGAKGCAETHLAALREIANGKDEFACVLEDDAVLDARAVELLNNSFLRALPPFDVLRLETRPPARRQMIVPIKRMGDIELRGVYRHHVSATGQIYSREGARRIVQCITKLRSAIDEALLLDCDVMGLRVIEVQPSLLSPDPSFSSTVGPGVKPPYSAFEAFLLRRIRVREIRRIISFLLAWKLFGLSRLRFRP